MHQKPTFCTCGDKNCPHNPINHDKGCTPCIEKNLKAGEIPSCFFDAVGSRTEDGYTYEAFARHVKRTKNEKLIRKLTVRAFVCMALVLVVLFAVLTLKDWYSYDSMLNSAPFWLFVAVHALECLVPAAMSLLIAVFVGRKPVENKDKPRS